jgi:hypothetical protein
MSKKSIIRKIVEISQAGEISRERLIKIAVKLQSGRLVHFFGLSKKMGSAVSTRVREGLLRL